MADTDWNDVEIVQRHIRAAADAVGRYEAASFEEFMRSQLDSQPAPFGLAFESPLEAIFYVWWHAMVGHGDIGRHVWADPQQWTEISGANYRLDFAMNLEAGYVDEGERYGVEWPRIAVELDGHAFHEKTKEQVTYRNQRDRALQQAGWIVCHFSFSEMTARPEECVGEVVGIVREKLTKFRRMLMERKAAEAAADTKRQPEPDPTDAA